MSVVVVDRQVAEQMQQATRRQQQPKAILSEIANRHRQYGKRNGIEDVKEQLPRFVKVKRRPNPLF